MVSFRHLALSAFVLFILGGPPFLRAQSPWTDMFGQGPGSLINAKPKYVPQDLLQDGQGGIWATLIDIFAGLHSPGSRRPGQFLGYFDIGESQWKLILPPPDYPNATAGRIVCLSDGRVACVWREGDKTFVTRQEGLDHKLWHVLEGDWMGVLLASLPEGGICVTEGREKVLLVANADATPVQLRIPQDSFIQPKSPPTHFYPHWSVSTVCAPNGSIYLSTITSENIDSVSRLRGVLRVTGQKIVPVTNLPFAPEESITAMVSAPPDRLYIAVRGKGIFEVGASFDRATLIRGADEELAYVSQMKALNNKVYLISRPQPTVVRTVPSTLAKHQVEIVSERFYESFTRFGSFWRVDGDNATLLAKQLEPGNDFINSNRSILLLPDGLFIGSRAGSPIWLPHNEDKKSSLEPVRLDHQRGLELFTANKAVAFPDGKRLLLADDMGWGIFDTHSQKPLSAHARVSRITAYSPILRDRNNDIWAFRVDPPALLKWEGTDWIEKIRPPVHHDDCTEPAFDGQGQLWMLDKQNRTSAVLDTIKNTWTTYPSAEEAITLRLKLGDEILPERAHYNRVISHKNGTVGFFTPNEVVHVLQNGKWKRWRLEQLNLGPYPGNVVLGFSEAGLFTARSFGQEMTLDERGEWKNTKNDPSNITLSDEVPPYYSNGFAKKSEFSDRAFEDRFGIIWAITSDGQLSKTLAYNKVDWGGSESSLAPLPFDTPARMFADNFGNAFLCGSKSAKHEICLILRPLPKTRPVTITNLDKPEASINISGPESLWQRWKTAEGEWSKPSQTPVISAAHFSPGEHWISIQVFDQELSFVKEFKDHAITVKTAGKSKITTWIQELADTDLAVRERAAAALRKEGQSALAPLRQALDTTKDETHRWWLEAVIEAIE